MSKDRSKWTDKFSAIGECGRPNVGMVSEQAEAERELLNRALEGADALDQVELFAEANAIRAAIRRYEEAKR